MLDALGLLSPWPPFGAGASASPTAAAAPTGAPRSDRPIMGQSLTMARGTDRDWQFNAKDARGAAVTTLLLSDTFAAAVWAGDGTAPLFNPTAALVDPTLGTWTLAISAAQTAGLDAGNYRLQATVARSGRTALLFDGALELTGSPGTDPAPTLYCTYADLVDRAPWIAFAAADTSSGQHLRERTIARKWIDEALISRYKPVANAAPQMGQPGYAAWLLGGAGIDPWPSQWFREQIRAGYLVVTDHVTDMAARYAISLVCEQQRGDVRDWQSDARRFRNEARNMMRTWRAEIQTPGATSPDVVVNMGATNLR